MSNHPGTIICRTLQKAEANLAKMFICDVSNGNQQASLPFYIHHHETIFISQNADGTWLGIMVCFVDPLRKGAAIIDYCGVEPSANSTEVYTKLFAFCFAAFRSKCIFHIKIYPNQIIGLPKDQLKQFGFEEEDDEFMMKNILPEKICLHNRQMRPRMNTINGEVSEDTLFEYFQQDDFVWGTYSGGVVKRGIMLGHMSRNGDVDFDYMQINQDDELNTGKSHSSTEFLNDGRIILYEDWEWTGERSGSGRAVIEEIR